MMTKEELISKLQNAVGGTAYGDALVAEADATYGDQDKKYGYSMKDRLDVRLGVLKAYEKIHEADGEAAKAVAEAEKIAVVEKALKAIEE
ncbi:MAG: hypothetical protein HUJ54_01750 [Erysipelotrichaceae bacterium]|nr:hypothetical protein [Erysipelotrichaceae bacterium]